MATKDINFNLFVIVFIILIFTALHAGANQVDVSWKVPTTNVDGTPLTDLAGFNVYYWQASWLNPAVVDAGNQTVYTLGGLEVGKTYHFAVTAYDASGNESVWSQEAQATIPNPSGNTAPIAHNGSLSTPEDTSASGMLSASDSDGDALTYELIASGSLGQATLSNPQTGAFTYTPQPNASGVDALTFRVNDGQLDSNTATVAITITAVNDAPVAKADAATTAEDAAVNIAVMANDSDPDGDSLILTSASQGAHGTVTHTNTTITYTPASNYHGDDSLTYTISDGNGGAATGSVALTVTAVNDAPVAQDSALTTSIGTPLTGRFSASDSDGDALTYELIASGSLGQATLSNPQTGAFTYTPQPNASGVDALTFRVNDGQLDSNTATVAITITTDTPPPEGQVRLLWDPPTMNVDGTPLTDLAGFNVYYWQASWLNPAVVDAGNQTVYTLGGLEVGKTYHFAVTAYDASGNESVWSQEAQATIPNPSGNTAPIAHNGSLSTPEDTSASGMLSASDSDGDALTYELIASGSLGQATLSNPQTGAFTYTPQPNASGVDALTFRVNDGQLDSNTATVAITITAVNDAPVAKADAATTAEDAAVNIAVMANDSDPDGDSLILTSASQGAHGTVTHTNTTITYTPASNYHGDDSLTYTISDGNGGAATGSVALTVTAVNDAPVAQDSALTTSIGTPLTGRFSASDSDGDALTYELIASGSLGQATLSNPQTGAFTYTPQPNASGVDALTFRVNDGQLDSNTATVAITITTDTPPPEGQVRLLWDPPTMNVDGTPLTDLAGFNVYYWQASWLNPAVVDAGNQTVYTLGGLEVGKTYHFAVTAYDASGNESVWSQEAQATIPNPSGNRDTDNDGLTDDEEATWGTDPNNPDTDADGLLDGEEVHTYITNPSAADTDGDQFSDGDEVAAGTDPLDSASNAGAQSVWRLERGEVFVNHNWKRVQLQQPFVNPIVVAASLSSNGKNPSIVRIRNVEPTGFEIRVQEWDYLDGNHKHEIIGYLVLEEGSFTLEDGTVVEAGQIETELTSAFSLINFTRRFNMAPVVLTSITTENASDAVTSQVHNIGLEGFEYRQRKEEGGVQTHTTETMSYIAWEPSMGALDDMLFEVALIPTGVTDELHRVEFVSSFTNEPVFLAAMQTTNEEDTAVVRWRARTSFSVDVQIEEETSLDRERAHAPEVLGYITFSVD